MKKIQVDFFSKDIALMWSVGMYLMFHSFFDLQEREDFPFHSVSRVV